ncbi:MAG TPA: LysR family transcriptional regulator, partial [Polyangiaceae bacterium]|nr:LysR family transcriptional regulator [Polyangiaceae bacterium]
MNIAGIDANLLVVLHVVLEEGSATRAARRLNVTQSAVSNALARLRARLGDRLVVRNGRGLVPTPRALALAPRLRA